MRSSSSSCSTRRNALASASVSGSTAGPDEKDGGHVPGSLYVAAVRAARKRGPDIRRRPTDRLRSMDSGLAAHSARRTAAWSLTKLRRARLNRARCVARPRRPRLPVISSRRAFAMVGGAPPAPAGAARADRDDRRLARQLRAPAPRSRATWCSPRRIACAPAADYKRRVRSSAAAARCATSRAIARHPQFNLQLCSPPRHRRCRAAQARRAAARHRGAGALGARAPRRSRATASPSRASASPCAATARGPALPRAATLTATGKPGTLQIRLLDPATAQRSARARRLHRRFRRAGLSTATARCVIGVVSWSTAPAHEAGCGGLTGVTPLLALPRVDRRDGADVRFGHRAVTSPACRARLPEFEPAVILPFVLGFAPFVALAPRAEIHADTNRDFRSLTALTLLRSALCRGAAFSSACSSPIWFSPSTFP